MLKVTQLEGRTPAEAWGLGPSHSLMDSQTGEASVLGPGQSQASSGRSL